MFLACFGGGPRFSLIHNLADWNSVDIAMLFNAMSRAVNTLQNRVETLGLSKSAVWLDNVDMSRGDTLITVALVFGRRSSIISDRLIGNIEGAAWRSDSMASLERRMYLTL